jgi:acetoin:2,6-dichlorophenolindophenol oxidoreductase subunit alpha
MTSTHAAPELSYLDHKVAMYRSQVALRRFEERAYDLFLENFVKGTSHLSIGQEAIAAGVAAAMRPTDWTFATYRGHAHTLARGVPMTPVFAELMGRTNGLMAGKGGSMHLTSVEHGMMGSYAIIGAHLPIACGAAWSAQYRGTDQVAVAFFGDGSVNIGAFHEALNFAAIWKLPVIFFCENNLWMEYTRTTDVTAVANPAADRAAAYGLESIIVDGNDADAVYEVTSLAIARARAGEGPSMIEAKTYRHGGHSRADPGKYRPDEELAEWLLKDPLPMYRSRLVEMGISEDDLLVLEADVDAEVETATNEAKAGDVPGEELLLKDVWADGGASWRN